MNQEKNNNQIKDELGNISKPLLSSRLFKFRAWVNDSYMAIQGTPDLETLQSFMFHYGNEKLLMLSTGMLDVKGIEIFEGDIIKFTYNFHKIDIVGCVKYSKGGHFVLKQKGEDTGWNDKVLPYPIDKEIIGNIFENPELL
jgi:uncharacterized phage protein (TIGR01671 family)